MRPAAVGDREFRELVVEMKRSTQTLVLDVRGN
jgi:hypothetical protein